MGPWLDKHPTCRGQDRPVRLHSCLLLHRTYPLLKAAPAASVADSGDDIAAAARTQADACIAALAAIGQGSRPLENELVFGNYNVAYVSAGAFG